MNALERERRRYDWRRIRANFGPFGDHPQYTCALIEACGGYPDVDRWAGSTMREWWEGETNGEHLCRVIQKVGLTPPIYWVMSCDEIRQIVAFGDFLRAAELFVIRHGSY